MRNYHDEGVLQGDPLGLVFFVEEERVGLGRER